jgi:hypothetical protein
MERHLDEGMPLFGAGHAEGAGLVPDVRLGSTDDVADLAAAGPGSSPADTTAKGSGKNDCKYCGIKEAATRAPHVQEQDNRGCSICKELTDTLSDLLLVSIGELI